LPCHMRTNAKFPYQRCSSPTATSTQSVPATVHSHCPGVSQRASLARARIARAAASPADTQWKHTMAGSR